VAARSVSDLSDAELLLELAWAEAVAAASPAERDAMELAEVLAEVGAGAVAG
jgi:hypothetical protein